MKVGALKKIKSRLTISFVRSEIQNFNMKCTWLHWLIVIVDRDQIGSAAVYVVTNKNTPFTRMKRGQSWRSTIVTVNPRFGFDCGFVS